MRDKIKKPKAIPHFNNQGAAVKGVIGNAKRDLHKIKYQNLTQQQQQSEKIKPTKENPHELAERHRKASRDWFSGPRK